MAQQPNDTGGPQATANIINQRADASRSLYQICIALSQRLAQVPGFEEYLQQLDPADPVESLWALFKTGHPLLTIYNAVDPPVPIRSDDPKDSEAKKRQKAIFRFSTACVQSLNMTESFILRDLDDNDTTGFVKVTQVVNRVLDIAEERGLLLPPVESASVDAGARAPGGKMTQRDYVVREIVDTERKYVQDLENLHDLKIALEQKGDLAGDYRHAIFMNINAILDFQRRFLIRIEATNSMAADQQQWGSCFTSYEEGFNIYHQFIAGHQKAAETALREFDKIRLAEHPVAADQSTLDGFLLKPMQRLTKYPLFLKDLAKNTEDPDQKADVLSGAEAANRVLKRANEAVEQRMLDDALASLVSRVDDWKSHHLDDFGKLLMHGHYAVLTGKSGPEKEVSFLDYPITLLFWEEDADVGTATSTTFISLNASFSAAKRCCPTGPRKRRTRPRLPGFACRTRTQSCS
jgi:cell division control protein 24